MHLPALCVSVKIAWFIAAIDAGHTLNIALDHANGFSQIPSYLLDYLLDYAAFLCEKGIEQVLNFDLPIAMLFGYFGRFTNSFTSLISKSLNFHLTMSLLYGSVF